MKFPASGVYAITQTDNKPCSKIVAEVAAAVKGGAAIIQYRDKQPDNAEYLATQLRDICHAHNVPLIINDDIDLAEKIGADGVHLGKNDGDIIQARERLGEDFIIGISCYDSIDLAVNAAANGATYVAFGRFFPSNSKPLASPAHIATLEAARRVLNIPIVAIGGILPENGAQLLAAGADILAVIGGIFDQNPEQAARRYQSLFH